MVTIIRGGDEFVDRVEGRRSEVLVAIDRAEAIEGWAPNSASVSGRGLASLGLVLMNVGI